MLPTRSQILNAAEWNYDEAVKAERAHAASDSDGYWGRRAERLHEQSRALFRLADKLR